jgi:outer membrane receptor protein involved in Fe transport
LRSRRWSLFVNDEWQLSPVLRLNLGLRSDWLLNGRRTTTPRIAALWSPSPQWTFKFQNGLAFREPNASERQSPDNPLQASTDLQVESTRSNEISALWRPAPGLDLTATAYSLATRDSIGLVSLPGGGSEYQNVGGMTSRGGEVEATQVFANGMQARASWSRQLGTDTSTGSRLSDSPRTLLKATITAPGPWNGARIGINLQRIGERSTLSGATLDSCLKINANLTHAPAGLPWELSVGIYNLTARRCADPTSPDFLQDSLQQELRRWRVQLSWAL